MTCSNLIFCIDSLFSSLNITREIDNINNVSEKLIVFRYDCTKMQDIRVYWREVAESKI